MPWESVVNRRWLALPALMTVTLLAACTSANGPDHGASGTAASGSVAPSSVTEQPPANPAGRPGIATNDVWVQSAIRKVDGLAASLIEESALPGMAVAVVHDGEVVFAKGYGVREVGKPEPVDADTVFQLASVSKPIAATVVASEVGKGTVAWDTPISTHLPEFALADPYVTEHATIADMFSHRSGLPDHAGDLLEDLGYDRSYIIDHLKEEPLNPFRAIYYYTNYGPTIGGEATARAAGTDWATLSEQDVYGPLGMTSTSSRFADFEANPNHAVGHVLVDGQFKPELQRQPDAQSPAGGVSASVTDTATWLAMVLNEGKAQDGTQVVDTKALNAALTPQMRATPGSVIPDSILNRTTFYGYGFNVGNDPTGRVRVSHSGAFYLGAGTMVMGIPDLDLGIVVLSNGSPVGAVEALGEEFADIAEFGSIQGDWRPLLAGYFAGLSAPKGALVGQTPPAAPAPASPNSAYVGTYQNDYYGPLTVSETGTGELVMTLGPEAQQFPLTHWAGQLFSTTPPLAENASVGTVSEVTFAGDGDTAASVTIEFFDENGLGTFTR